MLAGCADGGDAVSLLQVSAARVEVGKNGLTADGRIPSIEVESDGYWRVFAESSAAWVRTDPSAASGSCTVTLSVEANEAAKAMRTLRPEQQQVLRLSIVQGMSHQEISDATGMPLGTVKTHARRGLTQVREVLGLGNAGNLKEVTV